jgi:hypothetical protein
VAKWQTRRTQNPLPARACGFKSLLRYLFSRGFWSSGDWLLPRTKSCTHSAPITRAWGNGLTCPPSTAPLPERDSGGVTLPPTWCQCLRGGATRSASVSRNSTGRAVDEDDADARFDGTPAVHPVRTSAARWSIIPHRRLRHGATSCETMANEFAKAAVDSVFIHIPMNAPSGPTPIDMRRGCTSEKGADPPPRR